MKYKEEQIKEAFIATMQTLQDVGCLEINDEQDTYSAFKLNLDEVVKYEKGI